MSKPLKTSECRRWVVKIGSALLTDNGRGLAESAIDGWVEQIAELRKQGCEVLLVSSGAVAEGMTRLGWGKNVFGLLSKRRLVHWVLLLFYRRA